MGELLIDLNFIKEDPSSISWVPYYGDYIFFVGVPHFVIELDKVPSNVSFKNPKSLGTAEAESTLWNGVSCPNPLSN
jgi:hypothetical protein